MMNGSGLLELQIANALLHSMGKGEFPGLPEGSGLKPIEAHARSRFAGWLPLPRM
jgi:hypothetical protein